MNVLNLWIRHVSTFNYVWHFRFFADDAVSYFRQIIKTALKYRGKHKIIRHDFLDYQNPEDTFSVMKILLLMQYPFSQVVLKQVRLLCVTHYFIWELIQMFKICYYLRLKRYFRKTTETLIMSLSVRCSTWTQYCVVNKLIVRSRIFN